MCKGPCGQYANYTDEGAGEGGQQPISEVLFIVFKRELTTPSTHDPQGSKVNSPAIGGGGVIPGLGGVATVTAAPANGGGGAGVAVLGVAVEQRGGV